MVSDFVKILRFLFLTAFLPLALIAAPPVGSTSVPQYQSTGAWTQVISGNQPAFAVDTVANLKALLVTGLVTGTQIQVGGYYANGDRGGGIFVYNSASVAADNGGTVIAPTAGSGRWLRADSGVVNVRQFGAMGNNSSDDTAALQSSINFAKAAGVSLYVPSGTYLTTGFAITDTNGLSFLCAGEGKTIFKAAPGCVDVITLSGTLHSLHLTDFTIDGAAGTGMGLRFSNSSWTGMLYDSRFDRITAQSCTSHGIDLYNAFSVTLDHCVGSSNGGDQIRLHGGPGVVLSGCIFGNTASTKAGIRILGAATLIGCNGDFTVSAGCWGKFGGDGTAESDSLTVYPEITAIGCNIEDFSATGIKFVSPPNHCMLQHCTFLSAASTANLVALQFGDFLAGNPVELRQCTFGLGSGSTWKNGYAIHTNGGTSLVTGYDCMATLSYNDAYSLEYPINQVFVGGLDARASYYQSTGVVHKGGHEFDYLSRYRMGNPAITSWNDFMASPAGNAMPTSGTWRTGDVAWSVGSKAQVGSAGSRYMVIGWVRITDGSSHVLNTDWMEIRVLTGN